MRVYRYLILIICISFFQCEQRSKINNTICHIKLQPKPITSLSLSAISDSIDFIVLETLKEALMNEISKFYEVNDISYFVDSKKQTIFMYTSDGNLINKFGNFGRGEGEIMELTDVSIDTYNSQIVIWDSGNMKWLFYSYAGDFLWEKKENSLGKIRSFCPLDSSTIAIYSGFRSKYDLTVIDKENNVLHQDLPNEKYMYGYPVRGFIPYFHKDENSEITFLPYLSNTVYSIIEKKLQPKYCIEFDNNSMPKDYFKEMEKCNSKHYRKEHHELRARLSDKGYIYHLCNFKESNSYIFFEYTQKKKIYKVLFNKDSVSDYKNINKWDLCSNGLLPISFNILDIKQNTLIGLIDSYDLKSKYIKLSVDDKKTVLLETPQLRDIVDKIRVIDNPILIKAKLNF